MDYIAKVKLRHRGAGHAYRNILPGERFSDISPDAARALIRAGAIVEATQEPEGPADFDSISANEPTDNVKEPIRRKSRGKPRAQPDAGDDEPLSAREQAEIMRGIVEGE